MLLVPKASDRSSLSLRPSRGLRGATDRVLLLLAALLGCSPAVSPCPANDEPECAGAGGSSSLGGTAGAGAGEFDSAAFERPCDSVADCDPGMLCLEEDGDEYFGGGLPGGRCTVDCLEDPTACGSSGELVCVRTELAGSEPAARCFPACSPGDRDDAKCQDATLTACERLPDDTELGFCRPFCASDDDCSAGHCDRRNGACVPSAAADDFGASCVPDVEDPQCFGVCVALEDGFGVCSHRCRYGSAEPCAGGDGLTFCAYPSEGGDLGDVGYCAELCDCESECSHDGGACDPFESEAVSMALGAAGVCAASTSASEALVCTE